MISTVLAFAGRMFQDSTRCLCAGLMGLFTGEPVQLGLESVPQRVWQCHTQDSSCCWQKCRAAPALRLVKPQLRPIRSTTHGCWALGFGCMGPSAIRADTP